MSVATVPHGHIPIYRVGRADWTDPLDASWSLRQTLNRWNTQEFPTLYCCCSERVARAVVTDRLRRGGLVLEDLLPSARPVLFEIEWSGQVADMASREGIVANGFPEDYPEGVEIRRCQEAARRWHVEGLEGVVCRSASLWRLGFRRWQGDHRDWGEVAIFVEKSRERPRLIRKRELAVAALLKARSRGHLPE